MDAFTAVFEQDGEWWVGSVEELPGALTQGRTLDEARENLRDAVREVLEANRLLAQRERADRPVVREPLLLRTA
jgi:predicted RNase H-like HicB family nuclease